MHAVSEGRSFPAIEGEYSCLAFSYYGMMMYLYQVLGYLQRTCRIALACILSPGTTNSAAPCPACATLNTRSRDTSSPTPTLKYRVAPLWLSRRTRSITSSVLVTYQDGGGRGRTR